jgi:hypothetical protein
MCIAKACNYKLRTWEAILEKSREGFKAQTSNILADWINRNKVDQKAADAAGLVNLLNDANAVHEIVQRPSFINTVYFQRRFKGYFANKKLKKNE